MQEPQETQVRSLDQEDPMAKKMATHSSILAWRIPWMEELVSSNPRVTKSQTGLNGLAHIVDDFQCTTWSFNIS